MCDFCDALYQHANEPDFQRVKLVRGRNDYRCYECGETIPEGAQHEVLVGKWADDMATLRCCSDCLRLRRMVEDAGGKTLYGLLMEQAAEHGVLETWEEWKRRRDEFALHPTLPELAVAA